MSVHEQTTGKYRASGKFNQMQVGKHVFEYRISDICVHIKAPKLNIRQVVACDIIRPDMTPAEIDYAIYKKRFSMTKQHVETYIQQHILALPKEHW